MRVAGAAWVSGRWSLEARGRVELVCEATGERAAVSLGWVHRNLGEVYGQELFLRGRTRFVCSPRLWRAVLERAAED